MLNKLQIADIDFRSQWPNSDSLLYWL
jgi:hypothetical protein